MNTNEKSLEESIINLYLSLKIRKNDVVYYQLYSLMLRQKRKN